MDERRKIITLTAPSGAGKTTIARVILASNPSAKLIRSHTTRTARESDLPGEYSYNNQPRDFGSNKSEYLWIITAHGNTYATRRDEVTKSILLNPISLMLLVTEAVAKLRAFAPNYVVPFFIAPPSEEQLRTRLTERGDDLHAIERRISDGRNWKVDFKKFDIPYFIIKNDDTPKHAAELILKIAKANGLDNT